jgi:hypothetical protein
MPSERLAGMTDAKDFRASGKVARGGRPCGPPPCTPCSPPVPPRPCGVPPPCRPGPNPCKPCRRI